LEALPEDERDLLRQKYFARQSVCDIAKDLQTSEKAIESRLVRIRRRLKQAVLEELRHESAA